MDSGTPLLCNLMVGMPSRAVPDHTYEAGALARVLAHDAAKQRVLISLPWGGGVSEQIVVPERALGNFHLAGYPPSL